jgi:hypothetical protein
LFHRYVFFIRNKGRSFKYFLSYMNFKKGVVLKKKKKNAGPGAA